jgi:hypothetical protein
VVLGIALFSFEAPARALSEADQSSQLLVGLDGATDDTTGLDISEQLVLSGQLTSAAHDSFSGDGAGDAEAAGTVNNDPVASGESFEFRVGDQFVSQHTATASASLRGSTAETGRTLNWVLTAAIPILGDVRLHFLYSPCVDYTLHNDGAGARSSMSFAAAAATEDESGSRETFDLARASIERTQPGTLTSDCPGQFSYYTLVLHGGVGSTVEFSTDATSQVELPEPASLPMLVAGALSLALLRGSVTPTA